jgi:RNA polymerase sigma-70 factor, ECF subfamily
MELEAEIRTLADAGDLTQAATRAIEGYGPEVLGFLVSFLGNVHDADDAFAMTCEDLWNGLGRFEWRASARTWRDTLQRGSSDHHTYGRAATCRSRR